MKTLLSCSLFCCFVPVWGFQNFTPLEEMQMVGPACFPSTTKTNGTHTARKLTPQTAGSGVGLKQTIRVNSGATAQPLVSTAYEL